VIHDTFQDTTLEALSACFHVVELLAAEAQGGVER
jgi:hypothetical protein